MPLPLSLPTIQNWSCHSCGDCCQSGMIISVTDAERQRILQTTWTESDGIPARTKLFRRIGWGRRYRLGHQASGACVFLDDNKRCRIHSRLGEAAKPLPCRVYPFVLHPAGQHIAISLRYACPSATGNNGAPLVEQRRELTVLRDQVIPETTTPWPTPAIWGSQQLDWPDTLRIVRRLREMLGQTSGDVAAPTSLATRLVHALWVAGMLGQAKFDKIQGSRVDDLMDALVRAAPLETAGSASEVPEPSVLGKTLFRLIVAHYAVRHTLGKSGPLYRIGRILAGLRFVRGRGKTPIMQPGLVPIRFGELENPAGASDPDIDQLLQRYFQVKLDGMAFCGAAFYGCGIVEGLQNLMLVYPITMYMARWIAHGQGRREITLADAERALTMVDYHHGYSPAMAGRAFRQRIRMLARQGQIARLAAWYGR